MVILITGASHTGKTLLAQRMPEQYKCPYLSIDHLKMGLIRSKEAVGFYQKHGFEARPCDWDGPGMFKMIR